MKSCQSLVVMHILLLFSGCSSSALWKMSQENDSKEYRIKQKKVELESIKAQNKILVDEKNRLLSELNNREMTLDELSSRLQKIMLENSRIQANTIIQQQKKGQLNTQLAQYQREIKLLRANNRLPDRDKEKKIELLRKKIETYLKVGL